MDLADVKFKVIQYDQRKSLEFWVAAFENNLEEMLRLQKDPRVCVNFQTSLEKGDYVRTALDWAVFHDNQKMAEWLVSVGGWYFLLSALTEVFDKAVGQTVPPGLDVRGRVAYRRWNFCEYAYKGMHGGINVGNEWTPEQRKKQEEMFYGDHETSPNLLRKITGTEQAWTSLDFAVALGNKKMARHLLHLGGNLCRFSVEELKVEFPKLPICDKALIPVLTLSPPPLAPTLFSPLIVKTMRYNFEDSLAFWKAAQDNDLEQMKGFLSERVCINLRTYVDDSYVQTPLDFAVLYKNEDMLKWLLSLDSGAFCFRFTLPDLKERHPDITFKYCGRKTFTYCSYAKHGKLQDMIDLLSAGGVCLNTINCSGGEEGWTALDHAVKLKNVSMAKHILHQGGNLCYYTLEDLNKLLTF